MGAGGEEEKAPSLWGHPEQGALLEDLPQLRWLPGPGWAAGAEGAAGNGRDRAGAEGTGNGRTGAEGTGNGRAGAEGTGDGRDGAEGAAGDGKDRAGAEGEAVMAGTGLSHHEEAVTACKEMHGPRTGTLGFVQP